MRMIRLFRLSPRVLAMCPETSSGVDAGETPHRNACRVPWGSVCLGTSRQDTEEASRCMRPANVPVYRYCTVPFSTVRVQYRTVPVALLQYRLPVSRVPCVPYGSRLPKVSFYRYRYARRPTKRRARAGSRQGSRVFVRARARDKARELTKLRCKALCLLEVVLG